MSRRGNGCTPRIAKSAHQMWCELHILLYQDNSNPGCNLASDYNRVLAIASYTAATDWPTLERILTNQYGIWRTCNDMVIGGATTYKWAITLSESKLSPTASTYRTASAVRWHLGVSLLAKNRTMGIVGEMTSELWKCQSGYEANSSHVHLENEQDAYAEKSHWGYTAIGNGKCNKHRVDINHCSMCTK